MRDIDMTGERKLAVAVIIRALKDYKRKKPRKGIEAIEEWVRNRDDANKFLSGHDQTLGFWCIVAGINERSIRDKYQTINYKELPRV